MAKPSTNITTMAALVLHAFGKSEATLRPITMGHINATFGVEHASGAFILQRVNPIFAPEVNLDIVAIVGHLQAKGLIAPTLQPTLEGHVWHRDPAGGVWRLMTKIDGHAVDRCTTPAQCRTVGAMLGRFHRALGGVEHTFRAPRLGVHDTARHLGRLAAALKSHQDHRAFNRIAPLARTILEAGSKLSLSDQGQQRIVHGDPKISNFLFDANNQAIALIDLDTLAKMPLALELGDALRSWCSPGGEDPKAAGFVLGHFEASIEGYKTGVQDLVSAHEVRAFIPALGTIATELAARFACDALEESYFGWDRERFEHAWQHNLERAHSQWLLAQSFAAQQPQAARIIEQVFGLTA